MTQHRVALVSSSYEPHKGGVEEHVRSVARVLGERGHAVVVWTVDRGEHLGTRVIDGVEVRYLPTPLPSRSVRGVLRFLLALPWAAVAWWRAFRSFRPTVLHVQCFGPNGVYASALARLTRAPLVVSSHGETFADDHSIFDESGLLRSALRRALGRAVTVTGCSRWVLEDLAARFGLRGGLVVPNGVDLDAAAAPAARIVPAVVFAVGRIERVKGFDLLVEAFADAGLETGTRLVIGGEGAASAALVKQVETLGLAATVSFPGRLSRPEVAEHMARASVVVVPSRKEAFGIVVLEAWRAGAPLVVTSRGGPADLVSDGLDGLVVDPESTAALGAAMRKILGSPDLAVRLSDRGRATVRTYTWDRVVDQYETAYGGAPPGPARRA